ncbi:MAG: flagellar biosynthesis protein FlhB [Desulfovibrionaceae bacterium]|nr:flagellar biosynthesis protein FlhB [Desulfovibrionaceae bacterium]
MARDPSRTEKATPKRRNKARDKGNVPRSAEVGKTFTLVVGLIILYLWINYIGLQMQVLMRHTMTNSFGLEVTAHSVYSLFVSTAVLIAKLTLPVLLVIGLMVFLITRIQVGKLWTVEPMKPKLSKFNVVSGFKRILLSPATLGRMGKSLAQVAVIAIAPYIVISNEWDNFLALYYTDAANLASYMLRTGAEIAFYALIPMCVIAVIDLIYTRWKYEEDLKMTKSEVKDEVKQAEGDPMIKNKQRQKMFEVMRRRMMQDVPRADVVITNPTHIAVALKYNADEAPAPVVVAKGADLIAERIKEIAREHNVPIRENKPLARALYKDVEIGDMIPEELYQAVASILASLNKFKRKQPAPTVQARTGEAKQASSN